MNKTLSLLLTLILLAFGMVLLNCGNDHHPIQPTPQTSTLAFLQETPGQYGMFTPVLGTFSVTNGNAQFTSSPIKDKSTGQPISGQFWSITVSPDGKKGAVDLHGGLDGTTYNWDIWVASTDGSSVTQVTNIGCDPSVQTCYDNVMPQFSPDAMKLVFANDKNGYWQIDTINVDGTGEQLLPAPPGVEQATFPTYSPDGTKIAFYAWGYDVESGAEFAGIFVMNADGSNPQMLTNPMGGIGGDCIYCWDRFPAYTADGSNIIFSRVDESSYPSIEDIYVMNANDGSNVTKLTDSVAHNFDPQMMTIKGVGDRILFSSERGTPNDSTAFEIYSMKTDGSGITPLTNNSLYDAFCAAWYSYGDVPVRQTPQRFVLPSLPHHPPVGFHR